MDGETKLCNMEHTSEGTEEKRVLILPLLPLFLHSNLYFKTFLPLFSFRQWWSVSLRNISEWATAGLWTLMFSRTLGQKRFLGVWLHRPFLVDVIHHEFFKGFSLNNAQMSNHTQPYRWLVFFNLTCRHQSKHMTAPRVHIKCDKLVVNQEWCSCFSASWF